MDGTGSPITATRRRNGFNDEGEHRLIGVLLFCLINMNDAWADALRSWGDADASAARAALYGVILASLSPRSSGTGLGAVERMLNRIRFARPSAPRLLQDSNPTETQQRKRCGSGIACRKRGRRKDERQRYTYKIKEDTGYPASSL